MQIQTIRDLWEDFRARAVIDEAETPGEVALQMVGFACGVAAALGTIAEGGLVEFDEGDPFLAEALADMHLKIDRQLHMNPSPN